MKSVAPFSLGKSRFFISNLLSSKILHSWSSLLQLSKLISLLLKPSKEYNISNNSFCPWAFLKLYVRFKCEFESLNLFAFVLSNGWLLHPLFPLSAWFQIPPILHTGVKKTLHTRIQTRKPIVCYDNASHTVRSICCHTVTKNVGSAKRETRLFFRTDVMPSK